MSQQHRPPHLFPGRSGSMKPEQQQQQLPQVVTHANATLGGGLPSSVAVGLHAATTAPPFGLSSNGQSRIFPSNLTTGSSFSLLERIQAAQIPADQANLLLAQLLTQQQQPLAAYVPSFNPVQQATKQFNATTSHVAPFAVAASLQQPHHQEQHLTTGAANPFQEQLRQLHSVSRSLVAARRQEEPYLPPVLATAASALPSGRVPVMITHTAPSDKKPAANTSALSAKVEEQTAPTVAKHASPAKPSSKSSGKAAAPDKPKRPLSAYNLFFRDERAKMIGQAGKKKIGFSDMAKSISTKWKVIDDETSSMYKKMAAEEKQRYVEKMKVYNQKQQKLLEKSRQALEDTVDEETRRKYFDTAV